MMELSRLYQSISRYIYFVLLTILAVVLPYSNLLVSMCEIGLMGNFILEGGFKVKFKRLLQHKSLLIFLGIYILHLIWLAGTSDFAAAMENLRIKLPLLVLPLIIAATEPLDLKWIKLLLRFFIASVLLATLISTVVYLGITPYKVNDVRSISIFISHIRFSLLIDICVFVLLNWMYYEGLRVNSSQIISLVLIIWLIIFLMILESLTGLIVLVVTAYVLMIVFIRTIKYQFVKISLIALIFAIPLLTAYIINSQLRNFYDVEKIDYTRVAKKTQNGNLYQHSPDDRNIENGHKVWMYVCQPELRSLWNKSSKYNYDSLDARQQPLKFTLIRYMTSKGLRKDSVGFSQLSTQDISMIEKGYTNVIFVESWGLKPRIYEVIWEIDQYKNKGEVNKHSVTQRIVYMQIALHIIKENFWFGIGSGDIPAAYANYYKTHETGISSERQFLTHNEFLRLFAGFGCIGFLLIMFCFIYPPFLEKSWKSYYFVMIFTIILLSFLNEDTLDSQIGVTFAAYFYSLFLWGIRKEEQD